MLSPQEGETPEERLRPGATAWLRVAAAGQLGVLVGNAINFNVQGDKGKTELPTDGS